MTEERFNRFFEENFHDLWRFARRRTGSGAEADDVTAETFAVAWRRRDEIPENAARLWLFGVARYVLANHHREIDRRGRLYLRLARTHTSPAVYDGVAPSEEILWPALAALPEQDRELLLMRAWDGLSIADIAVILRISPANVSSRLHKARSRLNRELRRRDPTAGGHVTGESRAERSNRHAGS